MAGGVPKLMEERGLVGVRDQERSDRRDLNDVIGRPIVGGVTTNTDARWIRHRSNQSLRFLDPLMPFEPICRLERW